MKEGKEKERKKEMKRKKIRKGKEGEEGQDAPGRMDDLLSSAESMQGAFPLPFDPTILFTHSSADQDFDKILSDLDLSLAGDTTTTQLAAHLTSGGPPPAANGPSDADGLRQLFGIQGGFQFQQQPQPQAPQAAQQAQAQQADNVSQLFQQQQLLLVQQQQQVQFQQQQQVQQGLGVVYQLPSPFMQPVSALTSAGGAGMYSVGGQHLLQPGASMFTFGALPGAVPATALHPGFSPSAAAAPGMFMFPGGWPYMAAADGSAMTVSALSPSSLNNLSPTGQLGSEGGLPPAGAAAAQRRGRGRGAAAAAAAPGAEKPKGPSQRFRSV